MGVPWLIVPTYQEADNIEHAVARAQLALRDAAPRGFRILIVDDNSPDGTGAVADRLAAEYPSEVEVLHRDRPRGLGVAYLAAFDHALAAGASHVFEMDADGSHDPADLGRLLRCALDHADLVLGSRYIEGGQVLDWGLIRRAVSRGGSVYARAVLRVPVKDLTGGFKCFRREVLEGIELSSVRSRGYAFQVELTYRALRAGYRVAEIPIAFRDRERGKSKMSLKIAVEAVWLVPRVRGWRPGKAR